MMIIYVDILELVSKELNHLAAILQNYSGSFINFFIRKVNPILNDIYFVYGQEWSTVSVLRH